MSRIMEDDVYFDLRAEARKQDVVIRAEAAFREAAEATDDPLGFVFTADGAKLTARYSAALLGEILRIKKRRKES